MPPSRSASHTRIPAPPTAATLSQSSSPRRSVSPSVPQSVLGDSFSGSRSSFQRPPSREYSSRRQPSPQSHQSTSWSSSRSATPLAVSPAKSSSPFQQQQHQVQYDPNTLRRWADASNSAAGSMMPTGTMMSPLARALQTQWKQLQQDLMSPSTLHFGRHQYATSEEDVLRVLGSLSSWAEMAVEDAPNTVPYLLAFAVVPLPSPKTQVVALAALRGVLSSLPGMYGTAAASKFVEDIFLGEHQALQALCLCALVAVDSAHTEAENTKSTPSLSDAVAPASVRPRSGQRSLLSRNGDLAARDHTTHNKVRTLCDPPDGLCFSQKLSSSSADVASGRNSSHSQSRNDEPSNNAADLRGRITHISLRLLNDAATLCSAVADALLSNAALLKASLRFLVASVSIVASKASAAFSVHNKGSRGGSSTGADIRGNGDALFLLNAEDVVSVLLTLLRSESAQDNEAALVLCSYDAPRAVCTLAQNLAYRSYDARGAVHETSTESVETLLWNALKVLSWLTRGCPSGMKHYLSENESIPSFLFQVLTVPVAEIREAAALWLAALLETQAHASLKLVDSLLDIVPSALSASFGAGFVVTATGALVEMLRWRGPQMHVYGVSAILCWRWMLLSHPSRVAAVLQRDISLLATLIELILRAAPFLTNPQADNETKKISGASGHRGTEPRGGEPGEHQLRNPTHLTTPTPASTASLPVCLIALEAVHVLTLSFALGSLETRARLEAQLLHGTLTTTTLRRLRDIAHSLLDATEPSYYDNFPLMEVKLAEPVLSEGMQRAGATVCQPNRNPNIIPPVSSSAVDNKEGSSMYRSTEKTPSTSVVVRLTAGGQWRQLMLESLLDLTAGEAAPSAALVTTTSNTNSNASSLVRSASRHRGRLSPQQRLRQELQLLPFGSSSSGDVRASALAVSSAVAPIRVLGTSSGPHPTAAAHVGGKFRNTVRKADSRSVLEDDGDQEREGEGEEHRVDIHSIMAASLAEGRDAGNAADSCSATYNAFTGLRIPRTVREATLLPTSQSTTTFRFRVVQQAEGLGGLFVQDSMCTILQLAQHYTTSKAAVGRVTPGISTKLVRAVQGSRRASLVRGKEKVIHISTSYVDPVVRLRTSSPSTVFGSAPRFGRSPHKEPNPFAPVAKATNAERAWTIQELRREDVVLFLIRYTHLMTELPEAIEAVEDHLYYLRRQLQLCPTREVHRRCVLNDLYMNVYPNMHLFLRFINQQARQSRGVLQVLSSLNGGTIHSGNLLEVYDAVGQSVGLTVRE